MTMDPPPPDEYFTGGRVDHFTRVVILYRENLAPLEVPLDWFQNPRGAKADPHDFEIIDGGQTVRLGDFEAAADAILFDFDPVVRAKLEARDRGPD
jgi:hypothetical protein